MAKRLRGKTAKALQSPLLAVAAMVASGVPMTPFFAPLERALKSNTEAVRVAVNRTFETIAEESGERGAEASLTRDEQAARQGGFEKVAFLLAKGVIRKPERKRPTTDIAAMPPPLDLAELASALRSDTLGEVQTALHRIPRANRDELAVLVPMLIDVLATEERAHAIEQLTRALSIQGGAAAQAIDLRLAVPIVAGLLLDRDFYDQMSLAAILRFLIAALDAGYDIAMAWPWVPLYLGGARCEELRFHLAKKGIVAGLDGRVWEPWLRSKLIEVSPVGHPSGVHGSMRFVGAAAECLVRTHSLGGCA